MSAGLGPHSAPSTLCSWLRLPTDTPPIHPWTPGSPLWGRGHRATPRDVGRRSPHNPQPLAFPGPSGCVVTREGRVQGHSARHGWDPFRPPDVSPLTPNQEVGVSRDSGGSFPTRFRQTLSPFLKHLWLSKLNTSFAWRLLFPSNPLSLGWGAPRELPGASALGTHLSHVWAGAELTTGAKWSPARRSETSAPLGAYPAHGLG